jgi:16S rRNA (guanine527-N7)-methyltransferase
MENQLLRECLDRLNIIYTEKQIDLLLLYITEILKWNKRTNLVKANKRELIINHIADSLSGLKLILKYTKNFTQPVQIADAGSGAGLPGIPISIFLNNAEISLIERSAKRAVFLRNINILLNTKNLKIIESDIKDVDKSFDVILFRAFTKLERYLSSFTKILNDNGYIIAYKGRKEKIIDELDIIGKSFKQEIICVNVPFSDRTRHIVILNR